jgi:hypothetical protein
MSEFRTWFCSLFNRTSKTTPAPRVNHVGHCPCPLCRDHWESSGFRWDPEARQYRHSPVIAAVRDSFGRLVDPMDDEETEAWNRVTMGGLGFRPVVDIPAPAEQPQPELKYSSVHTLMDRE